MMQMVIAIGWSLSCCHRFWST